VISTSGIRSIYQKTTTRKSKPRWKNWQASWSQKRSRWHWSVTATDQVKFDELAVEFWNDKDINAEQGDARWAAIIENANE
jgi:hypothetical protein